ncbi:hypothetical protein OM945_01225 [Levilactobacillus namurensis]|nr:hypothetical protein [Levilactobacillus namurensis]
MSILLTAAADECDDFNLVVGLKGGGRKFSVVDDLAVDLDDEVFNGCVARSK